MTNKEEVLFSSFDSGWDKELPVTLITYPDGGMDLHSQTGPDWDKRIDQAAEILKSRGLKLKARHPQFIGATGGYITVLKDA